MAIRDAKGDVKQTMAGFRGPLMAHCPESAKSKFLSLTAVCTASGKGLATDQKTSKYQGDRNGIGCSICAVAVPGFSDSTN